MEWLLPITSPLLACIATGSRGPNIASVDPDSGEIVRLFHPRRDTWSEHFIWDGPELTALTQVGQVTITHLFINDPEVVVVRKALQEEGVSGG
ncbi:MAG: hypothetical protein WB566_09495 [Terriglobales bacterium]